MIHYCSSTSTKVFRSLKAARKTGGEIHAFASRKDAVSQASNCIQVKSGDDTPQLYSRVELDSFIECHEIAKGINPQYPPSSASGRRYLESKHEHKLFGFNEGRAIDAEQCMSVSARWVSYRCPIFINGRKRTIRSL